MRNLSVALVSIVLSTIVIGNAFYQKKQFYPSVVYITKSNPSMAVIYIQALVLVILMGKLMRWIFFGDLRAAEFEHLMERSWYAVTETCLAFTVFRDDFSPKFVALFTLLLFLKSFHWLAEDRVDFMERSPVISSLFHLRVLCLLLVLGALDMHFVGLAYQSTLLNGASVQLVFGFEYAILLTIVINIAVKYVLHSVDLHSEIPWEDKAVFLLYTELCMGFIKVTLYVAFVFIMVRLYTLPLFAFRPMYHTIRAFKRAFNDVILSRRAIRNMNTLYPDATPEELAAVDNVCIICREDMRSASKKLPCNHIFHKACLRSWFQRQQTCPTCRLNILRSPVTGNTPAAQPANNDHGHGHGHGHGHAAPAHFVYRFPNVQPPGAQPNAQHQPHSHTNDNGQQNNSDGNQASSSEHHHNPTPDGMPFVVPPYPFLPFAAPPPVPSFHGLSDEELARLEGDMREAVQARIALLNDIKNMLDASMVLVHQYNSFAATENAINLAPCVDSLLNEFGRNQPSNDAKPSTSATCSGTSTENTNQSASTTQTDGMTAAASSSEPSSPSTTSSSADLEQARRRRLEKFVNNAH